MLATYEKRKDLVIKSIKLLANRVLCPHSKEITYYLWATSPLKEEKNVKTIWFKLCNKTSAEICNCYWHLFVIFNIRWRRNKWLIDGTRGMKQNIKLSKQIKIFDDNNSSHLSCSDSIRIIWRAENLPLPFSL